MTDFGVDTYCLDSPRTGRFVRGVRLVAQAVYRRLITPRGALRGGQDEANYGLDLTQLVGQVGGQAMAESWKGRIRNECRKDPRVLDAVVDITRTEDGPAERWTVRVDCTTAVGPFVLFLAVSDVTVALVGLEAA